MTVYSLKPGFQNGLRPLAAQMANWGVTPNQITAAGLGASALTGLAFALGVSNHRWLLTAPLLLLVRMALNALDGMVAREHHQESPRGRILNEMADVGGDAIAYLPLMLLLPAAGVAIVIVLAVISEFAAVLDPQTRHNDGPLGKSDRAAAFGLTGLAIGAGMPVGAWATYLLAVMTLAGLVTIGNRLRRQL